MMADGDCDYLTDDGSGGRSEQSRLGGWPRRPSFDGSVWVANRDVPSAPGEASRFEVDHAARSRGLAGVRRPGSVSNHVLQHSPTSGPVIPAAGVGRSLNPSTRGRRDVAENGATTRIGTENRRPAPQPL